MTSPTTNSDGELDDPGRDPKGLNPPRNLFGGGADQDSGQGTPDGTGNVGPGDKPGGADRRAGDPRRRARPPLTALSRRATPG